jgi:signal transduction histidine kinase
VARQHPTASWVIAVAGPVLITAGALQLRRAVAAGSVLFILLLVVVVAGLLGGARPALIAVALGFLLGAYFFGPPYFGIRASRPVDGVALVGFAVVGGSVGLLIDNLIRLAEEQAALGRVATLVAQGAAPDELVAAVSEEVGRLLRVDFTRLGRYGADATVSLAGGWNRNSAYVPEDLRSPLGGRDVSTLVWQTGQAARMDRYSRTQGEVSVLAMRYGFRSSIGSPIMVGARLWGVMIAGTAGSRPLPRNTEERLDRFTDLVATAIANAEARAELNASRMRIVAAADQTRRRIERDLHDTIQQRLVTLQLALNGAIDSLPEEQRELGAELRRTQQGLRELLEEVLEVSRGVHPAILYEAGLGPALRSLARRSTVPVELDVQVEGRLPTAIEVAAYYVISEALTNAAKHAAASVINVTVERRDGPLHIKVSDDGIGGANPKSGTGLIGLTDRVEAVGGRITIMSPPTVGTTMVADLPV